MDATEGQDKGNDEKDEEEEDEEDNDDSEYESAGLLSKFRAH